MAGYATGMEGVDMNHVPNLPGYGFRRKQKQFHKPQTFQMVNGVRVEQQEGVTFERPKFVKVAKAMDTRRHGATGKSIHSEEYPDHHAHRDATSHPAWDAFDRHVLRFYGWFQEAVVETNLENYRVRHCAILYYLEDDTCHVTEKKMDNSGIPQGQLIRRHRFPGPDGGYLGWADLQVGNVLNIYGRAIQLCDCDGFTRQFYETQGMDQMPGEPLEQDAFMKTMMKEDGPKGLPKTAERLYREVALGGGHINTDMQQFLEWDRKVCRFYAIMDDLSMPQFERRPFQLLFFLADDTVEIREQYPLNCGRDSFPIFYRRNKLPRGPAALHGPLDQPKGKDTYVRAEDFGVGQPVQLLGYNFFVYDADEFTRQYFSEELGTQLDPRTDVRLPERAVPRPPTPKYTGYGSWEDSMGSVHSLMPKPPKRDMVKLYEQDGKVLRFTAQFHGSKVEDQDRLFVINFHLFDDTVSIHEPPQRNMGIVTGRYLEKGIHVNQITGQIFKDTDLRPGSIVKVYNREFEIVDMDEYTRKHVEEGGNIRTYDLAAVLEKIREGMRQQYPLVRDIFRRFDADKDGVITQKEFKEALNKWGFQPTTEEVLVLMRHFDVRQDGQISYNEFCDVLLDEDYTQHMLKTKPPLVQDFDPAYAERAQARAEERDETEKVRKAARAVGDVIYKQSQKFFRLFKEFSHITHHQTVTCAQIHKALLENGNEFDPEDIRRTVMYVLPGVNPDKVPYVDFLKAMVTSFHDLSATR